MPRSLEQQKRVDLIAILVTVGLSIPIALAGSSGIALINVWLDDGEYRYLSGWLGVIYLPFYLYPLWFWLALRARHAINRPKGAFERTDYAKEDSSEP